jgi:excisionase family DNA binding protein
MEQFAFTISEAAKSARRSRSGLYEDIQNGLLRAVRNGRCTRILIDDLKKYLAALPAIEPKTKSAKVEAPFSELSESPTPQARESAGPTKGNAKGPIVGQSRAPAVNPTKKKGSAVMPTRISNDNGRSRGAPVLAFPLAGRRSLVERLAGQMLDRSSVEAQKHLSFELSRHRRLLARRQVPAVAIDDQLRALGTTVRCEVWGLAMLPVSSSRRPSDGRRGGM